MGICGANQQQDAFEVAELQGKICVNMEVFPTKSWIFVDFHGFFFETTGLGETFDEITV